MKLHSIRLRLSLRLIIENIGIINQPFKRWLIHQLLYFQICLLIVDDLLAGCPSIHQFLHDGISLLIIHPFHFIWSLEDMLLSVNILDDGEQLVRGFGWNAGQKLCFEGVKGFVELVVG